MEISHTNVPTYKDIRIDASLECRFNLLKTQRLQSLKWYLNGYEFYRYMPTDVPAKVTLFPVRGFTVDLTSKEPGSITLKQLTYNASGLYKCEVSTDAPDFQVISKENNMTVVAFPQYDPKISGAKKAYHLGEKVVVDCTSAPSYPEAEVHWYINDIPADPKLQKIVSVKPELIPQINDSITGEEAALLTSREVTRRLSFEANRKYFGNRTTARVKCESYTYSLKKARTAQLEIRLEATSAGAKMAHVSAESTSSCLRGSTSALLQGMLPLLVALLRTSSATS